MSTPRQFVFTVASSSAPSWFNSLPYLTWYRIAGGSGLTNAQDWQKGTLISDPTVWHDATTYFITPFTQRWLSGDPDVTSLSNQFESWNGATVDTDRKQLIMVANGGHGDGSTNAAFALKLNEVVPGYERICDATPGGHVLPMNKISVGGKFVMDETIAPACFDDGPGDMVPFSTESNIDITAYTHGRPRAMHTAGQPVYANGRVWFKSGSSSFRNGTSCEQSFSFDVNLLYSQPSIRTWSKGAGPDGRGPWRYHGKGTGSTGFGTAIYDHVNNKYRAYISANTRGSTGYLVGDGIDEAARVSNTSWSGFFIATPVWAATTVGLPRDYVVLGEAGSGTTTYNIAIAPLDTYDQSPTWKRITPSFAGGVPLTYWQGSLSSNLAEQTGYLSACNLVYHAPSRAFFMYSPGMFSSAVLRKLSVPADPENGDWIWSEVPISFEGGDPANAPLPTIATYPYYRGTYGRFNIIRNFNGSGQDMLVIATRHDTPAWVMKLPNAEIA